MRSSLVMPSSGNRTLSSFDSVTARPSSVISPTSEAVVLGRARDERGGEHGHAGGDHDEREGEDGTEVDGVDPVEQEDHAHKGIEHAGTEGPPRHHRRTQLLVTT